MKRLEVSLECLPMTLIKICRVSLSINRLWQAIIDPVPTFGRHPGLYRTLPGMGSNPTHACVIHDENVRIMYQRFQLLPHRQLVLQAIEFETLSIAELLSLERECDPK
jgi:hypothetical protein